MPSLSQLAGALARLESEQLLRRRRTLESPQGARVRVDGREVLSFCSNDYLGLASEARLCAAAADALSEYGLGGGASHLVSGHGTLHEALEFALADHVGAPCALLFSTGYMANLGVVTALADRDSEIFADKLNHASLNDAALLSRAKFTRYPHLDTAALETRLARSTAANKLIVTDTVFSMDGDVAPVDELLRLAERHDAWLVLDDAHGFGVLGAEGRGALAHFGARADRVVYVGTLGKAAGVSGAFAAASRLVVDWLTQRSRTYIYTTAMPPLLAGATLASLRIIREEEWRRARLRELVARLRGHCRELGLPLLPSDTPIQALVLGDAARAVKASRKLERLGIWAPAIRPPTVPPGTARLRLSLSAAHSAEDIDRLAAGLSEIG